MYSQVNIMTIFFVFWSSIPQLSSTLIWYSRSFPLWGKKLLIKEKNSLVIIIQPTEYEMISLMLETKLMLLIQIHDLQDWVFSIRSQTPIEKGRIFFVLFLNGKDWNFHLFQNSKNSNMVNFQKKVTKNISTVKKH